MIKKILCYAVVLLMLNIVVIAQQQNQQAGTSCATVSPDSRDECCQRKGYSDYDITKNNCIMESAKLQEKIKERIKVNASGLENAMIRVRNEETQQHLMYIANNIETKTRARLNLMKNLEFDVNNDGEAIAVGKRQARLFNLFKLEHGYTCRLMDDGTAQRQAKWYDFLWKDIDSNICGDAE